MFAVIGTLAALHERSSSGLGQEVDVAIYEAVAALMESSMADFDIAGVVRNRSGGTLPGVAPANAYPTSDGSDVLIAGNADAVFARLCLAMGDPELADRPALRHPRRPWRERTGTRRHRRRAGPRRSTADAVLSTLRDHAVPAGRVYTAADMLNDPHYLAREMIERHRVAGRCRHADARCRARSSRARPARSSTSARPSASTPRTT